jgi:acetyl-CoA C-acetyltransferase
VRGFQEARSLGEKASRPGASRQLATSGLQSRPIANRTTGLSMGEHTEITAKEWEIGESRAGRDRARRAIAAPSPPGSGILRRSRHPVGDVKRDTIPRKDTSLEKLARWPPAFDRTSGNGTLTAGNSSPLTDGAAAIWVALDRRACATARDTPRERGRLGDRRGRLPLEGLLMAPAFAIPRLLARNELTYDGIALWELTKPSPPRCSFT